MRRVGRDSLRYNGKRIISFRPILKWNQYPFINIINEILNIGKTALGCEVEIEFSVNIYDDKDRAPEFCLLQIKPMVIKQFDRRQKIKLDKFIK